MSSRHMFCFRNSSFSSGDEVENMIKLAKDKSLKIIREGKYVQPSFRKECRLNAHLES